MTAVLLEEKVGVFPTICMGSHTRRTKEVAHIRLSYFAGRIKGHTTEKRQAKPAKLSLYAHGTHNFLLFSSYKSAIAANIARAQNLFPQKKSKKARMLDLTDNDDVC